jgi:hypothetical protein
MMFFIDLTWYGYLFLLASRLATPQIIKKKFAPREIADTAPYR